MNYSRRFFLLAALFITCLITANVTAVKFIALWYFFLPAGVMVFPVVYVLGDILTEVYGYKRVKTVIWLSFGCNLVFVFFIWLVQVWPAAPFWQDQKAYESILGYTPRLLAASFAGSLAGQFSNSLALTRIKIRTKGRFLWLRTIVSTIIGEFIDSAIFLFLAFAGTDVFMPQTIIVHATVKIGIEILVTPVTYLAVNYLKEKEPVSDIDD
jgi:queuosine precursor transporter